MLFHKCLPDLLQRSNLHATAANMESCWGVLGDPAKAALLELKWGRRLGTRTLPGNVRPWKTEQLGCPEYAVVDELGEEGLALGTTHPGFWSTNWIERAAQ